MRTATHPGEDRPPFDHLAWWAAVLCMLGLIVTMAGSSLGAILFLAGGGLLGLVRAGQCLRLLARAPMLWALPGFALVSVFWSQAPLVSLRAALQLIATVGIAAVLTGFLRPRGFVSAMAVSLLCGAMLSLAFGRYGMDGMTGTVVFLGMFASKNIMALFMSFLAVFALALLVDRGQPGGLRLLGGLAFLLSLPLLLLARSAGAMLTTAASLGVLILMMAIGRMPRHERRLLAAVTAAVLLPLAGVGVALATTGALDETVASFVKGVLGKDMTLTGRTVLWQIALDEIAKRPLLGVGYYAFWQQGSLLAEAIWRQFNIDSRMGFHFHNTLLEFAIELGWIGATCMIAVFALAIWRAARLAIEMASPATAALVAVLACLAIRTVGEVDTPYPFAAGTFLLFAIAAYGADHVRAGCTAGARRDPAKVAWASPA